MKKWLRSFIYAAAVFILIVSFATIYNYFRYFDNLSGDATFFLGAMLLVNVCFGVMLGLEHLIRERKHTGKWVFNLPRGIFLGIPSLLFSIYYFIYYSGAPFLLSLASSMPAFLSKSTIFEMFCQILFGYVLVTNFTRREAEV